MRNRILPLIVAGPIFLQNIDGSAITIALPTIASSFHVPALQLNFVITLYLLSQAVFLPLSAWLADRFGSRRIFCIAIVVFSVASGLCGMAGSTTEMVVYRVLQGLGAAMMVPVGRLLLLRSIPSEDTMAAMIWYTIPPVVGNLTGPLFGGAIVSVVSWRWIFFLNIPFGVMTIWLAMRFVERVGPESATPFDIRGFTLLALGLATLMGALEAAGKGLLSASLCGLLTLVGLISLTWYTRRSRRLPHPAIDLRILAYKTFRTNIFGAVPLRMAVSGVPFLLPLMFQLIFKLSPLTSGILLSAFALGGLSTRVVMRAAVQRLGSRGLLLKATVLLTAMFSSFALFRPTTPHGVIFMTVFVAGLLSSLCLITLSLVGFEDVPKDRLSHASALTAMAQQITAAAGVLWAASSLSLLTALHTVDRAQLHARDFSITLIIVAMTALISLYSFARLKPPVVTA